MRESRVLLSVHRNRRLNYEGVKSVALRPRNRRLNYEGVKSVA